MEKGDLSLFFVFFGIPLLLYYYNWIRNYFHYDKKINEAIVKSKRISVEKVEQSISYYSKRVKFFNQRLSKTNESNKKNAEKLLYWEKEYLKSIGKFSDQDWKESEWREKWDCFFIKQDIDREINLRKIFSPD